MKRFSFRLTPLLRLRRQQEEQKKRVVAGLLREIHAEQQQAVALAEAVRQEGQTLKTQQLAGRVDLEWVAQYRRYVAAVQNVIQQHIRRVAEIQQQLIGARQELVQAAQKTKVLEKLRERQHERYQRALRRAETAEQNEIGAQRFDRLARERLARETRPERATA